MHAEQTDADLLAEFAHENNLDVESLVDMAMHALAMNVRTHGTLTIPLQIGMPSPQCLHCPISRPQFVPRVIKGPWS